MRPLRRYLLRRDLAKAVNRRRKTICRRLTKDVYQDQWVLFQQAKIVPRVIVDIGAFVGEITDRYHRLFPAAHIHAIEPFPESFRQLKTRFLKEPHIHVYPMAISNQVGTAQFYIGNLPNNNSLLPQLNVPKSTIDVETLTLDALAEELSLTHIDILKIDTEGAEFKVLSGASGLLAAASIDVISAEIRFQEVYKGESLFPAILQYLNEYGYTLHNIYINRESRFFQADYGDATFLSDPFRKQLQLRNS